MRIHSLILVLIVIPDFAGPGPSPSAYGQEQQSPATGSPEGVRDVRESAMAFAVKHHPELARLLEQLEKSRPGEFNRAIRELDQQFQRLERLRERAPARYEEQLEAWKADSRIRVLMARWSRQPDPALEQQIRELLKARRDARQARLLEEQKRLEEQLERVRSQLTALSESPDAAIDREWQQLSSRATPKKKPGPDQRPAGNSGGPAGTPPDSAADGR